MLPGEKTLKQCDEDENVYTEEGPQENCSEKTNKQPVVDKGNQGNISEGIGVQVAKLAFKCSVFNLHE